MSQIQEVVTWDLKLEIFDVIMDDFWANISKLLHSKFLVLWCDYHWPILDEKIQVIQRYADDKHRHIEPQRAGLKQIDCEKESIVMLSRVEISAENQLVNLFDFRIKYRSVLILDQLALRIFAKMQQDFAYEYTSV